MRILCVDDERQALQALTETVNEVLPEAEIFAFRTGREALDLAARVAVEVAFLDIEMREINGLQLAKQLKECCKTTNIIFVTGYDDYALDAFGVNASGYLLKPVSPQEVRNGLENLRHPVPMQQTSMLRVQCFGDFEVFCENKPVKFQYSKTKELLAYLVDRKGAACTNGELMAILWEDAAGERKRSYLSNLTSDLVNTLKNVGCGNVVLKQRGSLSIAPKNLCCDFYDWNKGLPYAVNAYNGEYMNQFSWAEITLGGLSSKGDFGATPHNSWRAP